ncbi:MAG: phosphatidate cytidylyltransferase [Steroidobacteraceae bacterium]
MLRERILTGIALLAALLAALLWLPAVWAAVVLAFVFGLAAIEWAGFAGLAAAPAKAGYALLVAATCLLLHVVAATPAGLVAVLGAAMLWWFVALLWIVLAPERGGRLAAAAAGLVTLAPAWLATACLYAGSPRGPWLLLFAIGLVAAADTGAYFAGRRFGRVPLAPRVSPKKTWEGVFGGFLAAMLVAWLANRHFGLPQAAFLALSAATIVVSVVGDLAESLFKRHAGLKDSGSLLPGHGGVLDRIDSLTAAVPLLTLGLALLGELR